jgi:hypothetical protein
MMRWVIVLLVLLVGMASSIRAQETRLREPSAEEYLTLALELPEEYSVLEMINVEIQTRQLSFNDVPTVLLQRVHQEVFHFFAGRDPFRREWWNQHIILAWLYENQVDLNKNAHLNFLNYEIDITPYDFNSDGEDEWWLDVTKNDLSYKQYVVLDGERGNYRLVETPLPWFGGLEFAYWEEQSGKMESLDFKDITADGIPEWILVKGCIGGNHELHGRLYILSWRNSELVDLGPEGWGIGTLNYDEGYSEDDNCLPPSTVEWNFVNLDDDSALEIQQKQTLYSYYGGGYFDVKTFDWDTSADRYAYVGQHYEQCDYSPYCLFQAAQEAIWQNDYQTAIPMFERSIELFNQLASSNPDGMNFLDQQYVDYINVRLALAYSMVGRDADAVALIQSMEGAASWTVEGLSDVLKQQYLDRPSSYNLCFAMYEYYANFYFNKVNNMDFNTIPYPFERFGIPPRDIVERAGCDAPGLALSSHDFTMDTSPINQLKATGLQVLSFSSADLNGDGALEWLAQYSTGQPPIIFIARPETNTYLPIRPDIVDPIGANAVSIWALPGIELPVLVSRSFPATTSLLSNYVTSGPCYSSQDPSNGWIGIWSLDGEELILRQRFPLCYGFDMSDIFPDGINSRELRAYRERNWYEGDYDMLPTVYKWNSETQQYEFTDTGEVIDPTMQDMRMAFDVQDYEATLRIVEALIKSPSENIEEADSEFELLYWRAFTLEMLNRPDEALAEYIAIHQAAPRSSWGMLAALHLETIP